MFGIDDALMMPLAGAALGAVTGKNPLKGAAIGGALGAVPGIFGAGAAGGSGLTSGLLSSGATSGATGLTAGAGGLTGLTASAGGATGLTGGSLASSAGLGGGATTGIFSPQNLQGMAGISTIANQAGLFNDPQAPQATSAGIPNKGGTDFTSLMHQNGNQLTGAQRLLQQRQMRGY